MRRYIGELVASLIEGAGLQRTRCRGPVAAGYRMSGNVTQLPLREFVESLAGRTSLR